MTPRTHGGVIIICIALIALATGGHRVVSAAQTAALKIVVLEGEGAVNIIQQKTAIAPVIEVRDRNDQPVAGAVVRFAIQKGRASFNGARMLTATTDALGRATATGLTPIGGGPLQIGATAAFQGQTAVATIAQTNVLTAAQASAAATGGTGTASGGGLSHLAVAAIVGGGIAGGVLAKKNALFGTTYTGPFDGQLVMTSVGVSAGGTSSCASVRAIRGTLTIQLKEHGGGRVTGTAKGNGTETEISNSPGCTGTFGSVPVTPIADVKGTKQDISFSYQTSGTSPSPATVTDTFTITFTGTLDNGVITGALTFSDAISGQQNPPFSGTISGSGTTTIPVTLR